MSAIKSLRVLLISSLLSVWFLGIGSWSDFFGFPAYGLLPDNRPALSSNTVAEQSDDNPKGQTKNQFRQKQTILNSVNQKNSRTVNRSEGQRSL
jgi:hypothetical protein